MVFSFSTTGPKIFLEFQISIDKLAGCLEVFQRQISFRDGIRRDFKLTATGENKMLVVTYRTTLEPVTQRAEN